MIREEDIVRFVELLRGRLRTGAEQYGNSSFERPLMDVIGEIEQELLDTSGWSLVVWTRLQRLRERVVKLEQGGANGSA